MFTHAMEHFANHQAEKDPRESERDEDDIVIRSHLLHQKCSCIYPERSNHSCQGCKYNADGEGLVAAGCG